MAKKPIEIDCEEVWRQISNYVDDEVDPGVRAIMASHFKDCAHCSAILDGDSTRSSMIISQPADPRNVDAPSPLNFHDTASPQ